jgi:hypothetical protein
MPDTEQADFDVRLVGPVVERLLALESSIEDLRFATRCMHALEARLDQDRPPGTPTDEFDETQIALWHAAVLAYARCFVAGRRKLVADDLLPANRRVHEEIMEIRATHLAHLDRASTRESTTLSVRLHVADDSLKFNIEARGLKEVVPTTRSMPTYREGAEQVLQAALDAYERTIEEIRDALASLPPMDIVEAARRGRSISLDALT